MNCSILAYAIMIKKGFKYLLDLGICFCRMVATVEQLIFLTGNSVTFDSVPILFFGKTT